MGGMSSPSSRLFSRAGAAMSHRVRLIVLRWRVLALQAQLAEHLGHDGRWRLAQGALRHVACLRKQGFDFFICCCVHATSFGCFACGVHAYFPILSFIDGSRKPMH